ncbi:MAG: YdcF family protein [Vallitalea sp.]|jgi:uncharacterized SAM-binding protein YcdF (DUF218 family)|nr:YdcF family protein [Vallitalea sp.]
MKLKRKKKIITILILIIISYVIYVSSDIYFYGNIDELNKADAAIILGAGVWGDEPSPVFKERINHGIWLYTNDYVDNLIFTGGKGKGEAYSESSVAMNYAIANSVSSEDIFIEEQSTITQDNLLYASKIIEDNNFSQVIIVSDPLHMKRAMLMANDYGLKAWASPTPTTKYTSMKSKLPFLFREVFLYIGYQFYRIVI